MIDPIHNKIGVARAQLGTALYLFILDRDSFSIQSLACSAGEILDGLAGILGTPTVSTFILERNPKLDIRFLKRVRNVYWNSFKHFFEIDNKTPRLDNDIISNFSDLDNDEALFVGWHDYWRLTGKLPIEAQLFQAWWLVLNERKVGPAMSSLHAVFPNLENLDRPLQKRALRTAVRDARRLKAAMDHPATEAGPLMCRAR